MVWSTATASVKEREDHLKILEDCIYICQFLQIALWPFVAPVARRVNSIKINYGVATKIFLFSE